MPVQVRDRSTSRRKQSPRPRLTVRQTSSRQMISRPRPLCFPRRPPLRLPPSELLVRRRSSSGPVRGIRPSVVRGHRGASSERSPCRRRSPNGRSHGNPSPRRPIRSVRMCAARRGQDHEVSRCPNRPVSSSSLQRPLRLLRLRWRRQRAACGLRGECAEPPGVAVERGATGSQIPRRGCCHRAGSQASRWMRVSLCGRSGRFVVQRFCRSSGQGLCGTGEGSPPRWAAAAGSTAVSSHCHCHWRRCRRGNGGERRRGADGLLSGNRGRSHAVRACQGETLASCLLLKNCHLVQHGPLAVLASCAGHTAAIGFPTGDPAGI